MKISKSKQELARIISENGGWRNGEFATQNANGDVRGFYCKPIWMPRIGLWRCDGEFYQWFYHDGKVKNYFQITLSREEYLHLYPAPDADGWIEWKGGECPVSDDSIIDVKFKSGHVGVGLSPLPGGGAGRESWRLINGSHDVIAYRPNNPEQSKPEFCESVMRSIPEPEAKPTIEQLAADYRYAKDYADFKQQEADDAKADADEALRKLELAGEGIGLIVTPIAAKKEPELVITDWRYLQAGDVISVSGKWWEPDSEYTVDENDGSRDAPIRVGGYWAFIGECSFKFIRRP